MLVIARVLETWRHLSFISRSAEAKDVSRSEYRIVPAWTLTLVLRLPGTTIREDSDAVSVTASSLTTSIYSLSSTPDKAALPPGGVNCPPALIATRSSLTSMVSELRLRSRFNIPLPEAKALLSPDNVPLAEMSDDPERRVRLARSIWLLVNLPSSPDKLFSNGM